MKRLLIAVALLAAPAAALADPVDQVDYFGLNTTQTMAFDSLPVGAAPGANFDGVIVQDGVGVGERFVGQSLTINGQNDQLGDSVAGPLQLMAGAAGQNLAIYKYSNFTLVNGLGPVGFPSFDALGEGSVAFEFSSDQSQLGFVVLGADYGPTTVDFWRADGSLIQSLVIPHIEDTYYGFAREGGVHDIRGISIWNADAGGLGYDKLMFDVASNYVAGDVAPPGVPEPAAWALMITGFGLTGAALRRRRVLAPA